MKNKITVKKNKVDFNLYLITDRTRCKDLLYTIEQSLKGGVKAVQLREKDLPGNELYELALKVRELTDKYNAKLIINSRLDIALAINADGIHLSETGFDIKEVRQAIGNDKLIGKSTHNKDDALKALKDGADFVTLSPVYETPSKKGMGGPIGLDSFKGLEDKRIFALGGINRSNIDEIIKSKINNVALIGAVIGSKDVLGEAEFFVNKLTNK